MGNTRLAAFSDDKLSVEAAEQLAKMTEDTSIPKHAGKDLPKADREKLMFLGKELNGLRTRLLPIPKDGAYTFRVNEIYEKDWREIHTNYDVDIDRKHFVFIGDDDRGYTLYILPTAFEKVAKRASRYGALSVNIYPKFVFNESSMA